MFGAGLHAQSAGAALLGVGEQGLLPAMRCPFESADESQTNSQIRGKRIHFEDGVWAGGHAIRFAFTFVAVNHRDEDARLLTAGGCIGHVSSFSAMIRWALCDPICSFMVAFANNFEHGDDHKYLNDKHHQCHNDPNPEIP